MNTSVFYRGLLYALRERRQKFVADGDDFHSAFREMLRAAQRDLPRVARRMLENFDPVFGVSPEASEMVLEGERDLILSLMNPRLQTAAFKLSRAEATKELEELPSATLFRTLAAHLDEKLPGYRAASAARKGGGGAGRPRPRARANVRTVA
jgi:hypothetical protein